MATLLGRKPQDVHVWFLEEGTAPAFVREEGQLYADGPILRIEQVSRVMG